MRIFVTGGAGFIGSALIRKLLESSDYEIINLDKLTYAGDLTSIPNYLMRKGYEFVKGDICDGVLLRKIINDFKPNLIMHLAAESHVDRSIESASEFIHTNILGTFTLLEESLEYSKNQKKSEFFRFHHISTDEVYGDLGDTGELFTESTSYDPSSPYSASKASSDHFVRAWMRTYNFPAVITNCSNNYGPFHNPEKLIPKTITNAILGKKIPVYGMGTQIRDWLYVDDHVDALLTVAMNSENYQTYNIGGNNEVQNIQLVQLICKKLDQISSLSSGKSHCDLIEYVGDRPGHDVRYAIDSSKIQKELLWSPKHTVENGIDLTIRWYLDNKEWWKEKVK